MAEGSARKADCPDTRIVDLKDEIVSIEGKILISSCPIDKLASV